MKRKMVLESRSTLVVRISQTLLWQILFSINCIQELAYRSTCKEFLLNFCLKKPSRNYIFKIHQIVDFAKCKNDTPPPPFRIISENAKLMYHNFPLSLKMFCRFLSNTDVYKSFLLKFYL